MFFDSQKTRIPKGFGSVSSIQGPLFDSNGTDCYCKSNSTGEYYNFCYVDPQNKTSIGIKFNCSYVETMEELNILNNHAPFLSDFEFARDINSLVFVSTTSDDHFGVHKKSYEAIRKFYPNNKYILFGLKMTDPYIQKLPTNDSNFEFRQFNTSRYPKYVEVWFQYRFKPIIMAEMLREFTNIFWIDAHMKITEPHLVKKFFDEVNTNRSTPEHSPITLFSNVTHSNFAVLFPELLEYFPTNSISLLKTSYQYGANFFHFSRTEKTLQFFKWFVLCALEEKCMNPRGSKTHCHFGSNRMDIFANCFRYDQSVLNVLMLNEYQDETLYYYNGLESGLFNYIHNKKTELSPIHRILYITFWLSGCIKLHTALFSDILNYHGPLISDFEFSKNESSVVFVSTSSDDHYYENKKSYEAVRKFYPNHKYILFGLHMTENYIDILPYNDPNFEFRPFDTSRYPKYVEVWFQYRFKPLIMAEMLKEFSSIWWIDAHMKITEPNLVKKFFDEVNTNRSTPEHSPITLFSNVTHSNFAVLFPELLEYFPTNSIPLLKTSYQYGANFFHFSRTEKTFQFFKWFVLCALEEKCMNPRGSQVYCSFGSNRMDYFANCFRYDQSVLNLLMLNEYQNETLYYYNGLESAIERI